MRNYNLKDPKLSSKINVSKEVHLKQIINLISHEVMAVQSLEFRHEYKTFFFTKIRFSRFLISTRVVPFPTVYRLPHMLVCIKPPARKLRFEQNVPARKSN